MHAVTEPRIRRSFVNCSQGEAKGLTLPTAVRAADTRMSGRTTVMCLLCQTTQGGDAVSLFTAKRSGRPAATATPSGPTCAPT